MNPEQKPKILMLAGIIGGLMIVFGVMYFVFFRPSGGDAPTVPPGPVASNPSPAPVGGAPGMPNASGPGMQPGMPVGPGGPGMPPGGPGGPGMPPGGPGGMTVPNASVSTFMGGVTGVPPNNSGIKVRTSLVDPFKGGKEKQIVSSGVSTPIFVHDEIIRVTSVPTPVSIRDTHYKNGDPVTKPIVVQKPPAIGRHAGWMYNRTTGEVIAIFEDADGKAHTVRVGDKVGTWQVKAIAPEYLLMVDIGNPRNEVTVPLQGLDTYPGKTKRNDVNTVPNMPPMP